MAEQIDRKKILPGEFGVGINQEDHVVVVWNTEGVLSATFFDKNDIDELFRNGGRLELLKTRKIGREERIFRDL
jgi:hypothetical protein